MSVPKVAIAYPYYKSVDGPTAGCMMGLAFHSGPHIAAMPIDCSGCYIEDNRNGAVKYALATGIPFDWFFWVDSDMQFPPDALLRLIGHGKDIVGANYRTRTPPFGFAGHYLDGSDKHILEPGLHQMSHLPTGLLLVRFEIFQKLPYPWFDAALDPKPRDDVYFCNYAREHGYEIWCDHDLTFQARHRTVQDVGWFGKEQVIMVKGAELDHEHNRKAAEHRAELSRQQFVAGNAPAWLKSSPTPPGAGASTGRNGADDAGTGVLK